MKLPVLLLPFSLLGLPLLAQDQPNRPRITGIDHVRIYVTDIDKSRQFYTKLFGARFKGGLCYDTSLPCFTVGWAQGQTIELAKVPAIDAKDWLAEIAFATDDIEQMRSYLIARGEIVSSVSRVPSPYDKQPYDAHFELLKPEGTPISFIQRFA